MASARLSAGAFGIRNSSVVVNGNYTNNVSLPLAGQGSNTLDVSATELAIGPATATGKMSATGVTNTPFVIGGSLASTGNANLTVRNATGVSARASARLGAAAAKSGFTNAVDPAPPGGTGPTNSPDGYAATGNYEQTGGILNSSLFVNGDAVVNVGVSMEAISAASAGGDGSGNSGSSTAEVYGSEGYGVFNTPLSAGTTTTDGTLRGMVSGVFGATANQTGTGAATAKATTARSAGISNRGRVGNLSVVFGGGSSGQTLVEGEAGVLQSAAATTTTGPATATSDVSGVAGILNDASFISDDLSQTSFDIEVNDIYGGVTGAGGLVNTATADTNNGGTSASAVSDFVGGVLDVGTAGRPFPSLTPGGSSIDFKVDGYVLGDAAATASATATSVNDASGQPVSATAANRNVIGLSWDAINADRDIEIGATAVNEEDASASTPRSGEAGVSAYAGEDSNTIAILNTDINTGDDGGIFGLETYGAGVPVLADAIASGYAIANAVSSDVSANAAVGSYTAGTSGSNFEIQNGVTSAPGVYGGLLVSIANQDYLADAIVSNAIDNNATAVVGGQSGPTPETLSETYGVDRSTFAVDGSGHLFANGTSVFGGFAYTTDGSAVADTNHFSVGLHQSAVDIGGGADPVSYDVDQRGILATGTTRVNVLGAVGSNQVYTNLFSQAAGIFNSGLQVNTPSSNQIKVGDGDVIGGAVQALGPAYATSLEANADMDARLGAVGIYSNYAKDTDASSAAVKAGGNGSITGTAFVYGIDGASTGDPSLMGSTGETAETTVGFDAVTGIAGARTGSTAGTLFQAGSVGNITGAGNLAYSAGSSGSTSATTTVNPVGTTTPPAGRLGVLGSRAVTGIQNANLLLPGTGAVTATADVLATNSSAASLGAATTTAGLSAVALQGRASGGNTLRGFQVTNITAIARLDSLSTAQATSGASTVTDVGGAGGIENMSILTLGDAVLNTIVTVKSAGTSTSFTGIV